MRIDPDRVFQKIAFIKEQIDDINELISNKDYPEIANDKLLVKGVKYSLQTAIESIIDIAYHIAAKKYNQAPEDARNALLILKKNGLIDDNDYHDFCRMVGFRNRMVHLYEDVSEERIYEYCTSRLGDFETFIEKIQSIVLNE